MGGPLCPMPDRQLAQADLRRNTDGRVMFSGFHRVVHTPWGAACVKCSKTWTWADGALQATWPGA
jgi:hypothetical protein